MKFESEVSHLTRPQIEETSQELLDGIDQTVTRRGVGEIRAWNNAVLENSLDPIILVLHPQRNLLGDIIRASHWIPLLKHWAGRALSISSEQSNIFADEINIGPSSNIDYSWILRGLFLHQRALFKNDSLSSMDQLYFKQIYQYVSEIEDVLISSQLNNFQRTQLSSYIYFGRFVEELPKAEISFSGESRSKAKSLYEEVLLDGELPVLVSPDASSLHFFHKKWATKSYVEILTEIQGLWGERIRIILITGTEHPFETELLGNSLDKAKVPHTRLGIVRDLGTFGALIEMFAKRNAVMLGTESMVTAHLGPVLGAWSVVLGWEDLELINHYRPPEAGCTVVIGKNSDGRPAPKQVLEALNPRIEARLV